MADITFPIVLTDGSVLDPDVVNKLITSGTAGESLLGEMNGHLEAANLSAGFTVRPEHIKPGSVFRVAQEGATNTMDWTEYLFPPNDGSDESAGDTVPSASKFVGIPGTGAHIYLPYNYSAVLYRVSLFCTVFRMREYIDQSNIGTPQIFLQMAVDGDGIQSTTSKMPETYRFDDANNKTILTDFECVNTRHFDFSYLSIAGADSYNTKGWHRMSLRTRIIPNGGVENLAKPYKTAGTKIDYEVGQRLRIGIRNARIFGYR